MPTVFVSAAEGIETTYPDFFKKKRSRVGYFVEVWIFRPLWTEPALAAITTTWTEPAITPTTGEDE